MIEEISSEQYIDHYFEKAFREVGYDVDQFLRATVGFLTRHSQLKTESAVLERCQTAIKGKSPANPSSTPVAQQDKLPVNEPKAQQQQQRQVSSPPTISTEKPLESTAAVHGSDGEEEQNNGLSKS